MPFEKFVTYDGVLNIEALKTKTKNKTQTFFLNENNDIAIYPNLRTTRIQVQKLQFFHY